MIPSFTFPGKWNEDCWGRWLILPGPSVGLGELMRACVKILPRILLNLTCSNGYSTNESVNHYHCDSGRIVFLIVLFSGRGERQCHHAWNGTLPPDYPHTGSDVLFTVSYVPHRPCRRTIFISQFSGKEKGPAKSC